MHIHRKTLLTLAAALLVLAVGTVIYLTTPPNLSGESLSPPKPMPDFTLQSGAGPVSPGAYRGKLVVLFFGYTNCKDVCPLTMANLKQALDLLSPAQAGQVQVIFVSVDYKRDTPEKAGDYAHAFNPGFLGLGGSQAQIDAVTKDYGIYYKLDAPDANGYYEVEHTSSVSVLDRQGSLTLIWPSGTAPSDMAADLKTLLRR